MKVSIYLVFFITGLGLGVMLGAIIPDDTPTYRYTVEYGESEIGCCESTIQCDSLTMLSPQHIATYTDGHRADIISNKFRITQDP